MNKLVSRNPVQRFKQGRKIEKFQKGKQVGATVVNPPQRYTPGGQPIIDDVLDRYSTKKYIPITNSEQLQKQQNKGIIPLGNISSAYQKHIAQGLERQKNQKETTQNNPPVDNYYLRGFENIKDEIDKLGGVRAVQKMLRFTEGNGLDGKWGANTQKAYEAYLQKNAPTLPTSEELIQQVSQTPVIEDIPQAGTDIVQKELAMMQSTMPAAGTYNPTPVLPKLNRSDTRWVINDVLGKNAYNFTGNQRRALRQYLNGEDYNANDLAAFGNLDLFNKYKSTQSYKKGGNMILPSRNIVERFKEGRKIDFLQSGGKKRTIKRFKLSASDNSFSREFDTEEEAKAYRKAHNIVGKITDQGESWKGNVIKTNRTSGKDASATAYGRQQEEKYNNLSYKNAYKAAQSSGNKYFAYKGKVYKTDLKNGKDNMTEMMGLYGNNLGWDKDPKLQNKQSRSAREQYRKDVKATPNNRPVKPLETNSSTNERADKYAKDTWNSGKGFVDALMPTNVVMKLGEKGIDKVFGTNISNNSIYRSGLNPFGYAEDAIEGNLGGLAVRGIDAYATLGMPGASQFVDRTLTARAPQLLQVSSKSKYIPKGGLENGTLSKWNWNSLGKRNSSWFKGVNSVTEGGRRSIQRAANEGFRFTGAAKNATNFGQNVNTGTTFFFKGAPTSYDVVADRAVQATPYLGIPFDFTTQVIDNHPLEK